MANLTIELCSLLKAWSADCPAHAGCLSQVYYQGKKAIDYNAEFFFYDTMLVSGSGAANVIMYN